MFTGSLFDLPAYLERIRYGGSTAATLTTLEAIALRHPIAIPFENLDPFLRRPVQLDIESIQRKLVRDQRGGWCFEQNLLLGAALTALGFRPAGLGARVMLNVPPDTISPRSHMVLLLELQGRPYIVDAGFGGLTLTAPVRLEADVEQDTPHEPVRLRLIDGEYYMEVRLQNEWRTLYRFDLQRQRLPDYEVSNWYLCTNPRSNFLTAVIAARVERDRRFALRSNEFAVYGNDGVGERSVLASGAELRNVLETSFRIRVPNDPEFDEAFEKSIAAAPVV